MARIETAPEVLDDFDRFFAHLTEFEVADVTARLAEIVQAVDVLATSPLIGRPVEGGKRELVIGSGCATGFGSETECLAASRKRRHTDVPAGPRAKQDSAARGHGYVALYRYVPEADTVFLLAVRNPREAGYGREP